MQPPEQPPAMDSNSVRFLHQFRPAEFNFDIGRNGRRILHLGELTLLEETRRFYMQQLVRKKVQLVVCNDVVILCYLQGAGDSQCMLAAMPQERNAIVVESYSMEKVDNVFKLTMGSASFILQTPSAAEKAVWMQLLADKSSFVPTADLRGVRLVPLTRLSRDETVKWLNIPNPFVPEDQAQLEKEWRSIPMVSARTRATDTLTLWHG